MLLLITKKQIESYKEKVIYEHYLAKLNEKHPTLQLLETDDMSYLVRSNFMILKDYKNGKDYSATGGKKYKPNKNNKPLITFGHDKQNT
jgi:hypothetical protein